MSAFVMNLMKSNERRLQNSGILFRFSNIHENK